MTQTPRLDQAIYTIQQKVETISREDKAGTGTFTYKYAGMPKIWSVMKPLLAEHELLIKSAVVTTDGTTMGDFLKTTLVHIPSGESETWIMRLVMTKQDPQAMGSAITYAKRYQLGNIFGLITEDDNDAKEHKLATSDQKKQWVTAYTTIAKKANPDVEPTYNNFMKFLDDVYGKPLGVILASESDAVLGTIKAFEIGDEVQSSTE